MKGFLSIDVNIGDLQVNQCDNEGELYNVVEGYDEAATMTTVEVTASSYVDDNSSADNDYEGLGLGLTASPPPMSMDLHQRQHY